MTASTVEQNARYVADPRRCIDCGSPPSAGRPRCNGCHQDYTDNLAKGRI